MGKVYKDKKSNVCALCKPHKHGWAPKKKPKAMSLEEQADQDIKHATGRSGYNNVSEVT